MITWDSSIKMMSSKSCVWIWAILAIVLCVPPCANAEIVNSDLVLGKDSARNITLSEQMNQLLDLFNTNRLAESWLSISEMVTSNCSRDMEHYLQGLTDHAMWAMRSKFYARTFCFFGPSNAGY